MVSVIASFHARKQEAKQSGLRGEILLDFTVSVYSQTLTHDITTMVIQIDLT